MVTPFSIFRGLTFLENSCHLDPPGHIPGIYNSPAKTPGILYDPIA